MITKKVFMASMIVTTFVSATVGALAVSKFTLVVNGKTVNADIKIINDRSYIPLRAVSETLGAQVGWDNKTNTISINMENTSPTVPGKTSVKSYPVNVEIRSGSIKMKITKVTLDPAFKENEYSQPKNAVLLTTEVENTSNDTVSFYPSYGTVVFNTKEQVNGGHSKPMVEGEFVGQVIKKGTMFFEVNSNLNDITGITYKVNGAHNESTDKYEDDQTVTINFR